MYTRERWRINHNCRAMNGIFCNDKGRKHVRPLLRIRMIQDLVGLFRHDPDFSGSRFNSELQTGLPA